MRSKTPAPQSRAAWLLIATMIAGGAGGALTGSAAAHGTGTDVFAGTEAVYSVAWNPEGTIVATASAAGTITLYDGVGHARIKKWEAAAGPINQIAFSPDGSKIASASGVYKNASFESNVKVFDVATNHTLLTLTGHNDWVTSVVWSPDGRFLASASGVDDHADPAKAFGEVFFWDSNSGARLWNATPLPSYPTRIAWSPDGSEVASVGHLSDIWLLRFNPGSAGQSTMEMVNRTHRDPAPAHASHGWSIAWSPDSRYLAAGFSRDLDLDGLTDIGPVVIVDTQMKDTDGMAVHLRAAAAHTKPAEWIGWDSTGSFLASCSGVDRIDATGLRPVEGTDGKVDGGELVVYDNRNSTTSLKVLNAFVGGTSWCSSVAWRPGNLSVAGGNADGSVRVYALDEDGDGCYLWADAAPSNPNVCATPSPVSDTSVALAALLALGAAGAAATTFAFVRRRAHIVREEERRSRKGHRRKSGGRARTVHRTPPRSGRRRYR